MKVMNLPISCCLPSTDVLTIYGLAVSNNNNQVRSFWRGSNHVFVVIAEINKCTSYTIRVKLQEEVGGSVLLSSNRNPLMCIEGTSGLDRSQIVRLGTDRIYVIATTDIILFYKICGLFTYVINGLQ